MTQLIPGLKKLHEDLTALELHIKSKGLTERVDSNKISAIYDVQEIIIAFDIDGTLISNENGLGKEHLNVEVFQLMVLLSKMKNTKIFLWSGGGRDYTEQICIKYGLAAYVGACRGKHEYDESIDGKVDIAFDDQHEFSLADKNLIVRMK